MNRTPLILGISIIAALAALPFAALAQDDPASIMHDFSITHAQNPEAALELLADDVTIRIVPPPADQLGVWSGKEEARAYFGFIQVQDARRELQGEWQVDGNNVRGSVMVTARQLIEWGVAPVEVIIEAVIEDGKIVSWTATTTPEEQERIAAALRDMGVPQVPPQTGGPLDLFGVQATLLALGVLALAVGFGLRTRFAQPRA
jgi:hypothetical protein